MDTRFRVGDIVEAEVAKIADFGAFVKINGQHLGLIHISQISSGFVKKVSEHLKVGDKVRARIIKLGPGKKIDLTLKKFSPVPVEKKSSAFKSSDFEEKLQNFLKST